MQSIQILSKKIRLLLIAMGLGVGCLSASAQVVRIVDKFGVLTGAKNIPVSGALYDVRFDEGAYSPLFEYSGPQAVKFDNATAMAASQALLDVVFIDGTQGQFDSTPGLTKGCWYGYSTCVVYTPLLPGVVESLSPSGLPRMTVWSTLNFVQLLGSNGYVDGDYVKKEGVFILDSTNSSIATWAIWSPTLAVPEPETYAMLLSGLGLMGAAVKRRMLRQA